MPAGLRHPDWYLISEQRFRRRAAVRAVPLGFRGEGFLVLSDRITGTHLRLSQRAEALWQLLDGRRTAQEVWQDLSRNPATAPSQGEVVDWILQLVSAGLLLSDHDLNPEHLTHRNQRRRNQKSEARAASPLSIRISLFDPQAVIRWTYPLVRPLFSRAGAALLLALLIVALVAAAMNAGAILSTADTALLSQSGVVALFLSYPVMKALHELAHGWAVHHFGAEVRDCGVMLLIFFPVPYVDASASSAFPDRRARMLVGAAGIIAELAIAAIALLVWLQIEPGVERAVLFSFVVMGTLSTLLFNGNPLLKFDAYFVLCDWLEMPNLATRAGALMTDRFVSRTLGLRRDVATGPGEAPILLVYGALSVAYRMMLMVVVSLIVAQMFFVLGVLLAAWSVVMGLGLPLARVAKTAFRMARAQNRAPRALRRAALLGALAVGFGGFVPLPFAAQGEGQVVPMPVAELRMGSSGVVQPGSSLPDGARIARGSILLSVDNAEHETRLRALRLSVDDLEARLARGGLDLADRQGVERALDLARRSLAEAAGQAALRDLRTPLDGQLAWVAARAPLPGLHVFRGDLLGHVIAPETTEVVLAFHAAYAGLIPDRGGRVALRLSDGTRLDLPLDRVRVLDAGQQVPPPLLVQAGGPVPQQPDAPDRALAPALVAWVAPHPDLADHSGQRVEARIDLAPATLAQQALFHLRRLFLRVTRV